MRRTPVHHPDEPSEPPLLAGRWRLVRTLEARSSGAVFLAWDDAHRSWRAVEVARDEGGIRRLQRERAALQELDHPNIDTMTPIAVDGPVLYTVRRYVRDDALRFAPMSPGHALRLALAVTDALAHAHARGVVHGALGPDRVRFDADGQVVVTGWTDRFDPMAYARLAWLAPEVRGGGAPEPRSDLYSVGALLLALLTGPSREPPIASALDGLAHAHRMLVGNLCAPDPDARPKSASELREWLLRRSRTEETSRRTPWGPKLLPPGPPPILTLDAPLAGMARLLAAGRAAAPTRPPRPAAGDSASGTLDPDPRSLHDPADRSSSSSRGSVRRLSVPPVERPAPVAPPERGWSRRRGLVTGVLATLGGLVAAVLGFERWADSPPAPDPTAGAALVEAVLAEQGIVGRLSPATGDPSALERAWFAFADDPTPEAATEVVGQVAALDRDGLDPSVRRAIRRLEDADQRWRSGAGGR